MKYGPDLTRPEIWPREIKQGDLIYCEAGTVRIIADAFPTISGYSEEYGTVYAARGEIVETATGMSLGREWVVQGNSHKDARVRYATELTK